MFIGAHCDDIEIGMGGTILKLVERYPDASYSWVTFSSDPVRERETRAAAERLLSGATETSIVIKAFRSSFFPYVAGDIKEQFEALKTGLSPDVIFTHCSHDLHQDHRVVNELTWNTFRNHLILEYEIPKYDGGLRTPNWYVPISASELQRKLDILMTAFRSQQERRWFTRETFLALARLRGVEANASDGYAEGFHCRKAILDF